MSPAGLISVSGGKLTTYRRMAADAVDAAMDRLDRRGRSRTKKLRLLGAEGYQEPTTTDTAAHLRRRYGTLAREVEALIAATPELAEPLVPGLPYVGAEAVYAARHEMARSLDDVLSRRTRARLMDRSATSEAAPAVARLIAPEMGWDDSEVAAQVAAYRASVAHEVASGIGPDPALDIAHGA